MPRTDISPYLIHFTKGVDDEAAFKRLQAILREGKLNGFNDLITGKKKCVCFSEAPLANVAAGLVNQHDYSRYSLFGFIITKKWLFSKGGRPVIYQTRSELSDLPEDLQWRHVTYDLRVEHPQIDFTWEREWRIPCDALEIAPANTKIILPNNEWATRLQTEHESEEDYNVQLYSTIMAQPQAEQYREPFNWEIIPLQ